MAAFGVALGRPLASGQYRGEFTRAAYGGAEVDQGLLYGFERQRCFDPTWLMNDVDIDGGRLTAAQCGCWASLRIKPEATDVDRIPVAREIAED